MFTIEGEHATARVFIESQEGLGSEAQSQIYEVVNHPAFTDEIAIMPDCHAGKGVVVGFSMPLGPSIVPEVIGTDIGCGMYAWRLDSVPEDVTERAAPLRTAVPGRGRDNDDIPDFLTEMPYDDAMATLRNFKRAYSEAFGERVVPPFSFTEYDADYVKGLFERAEIAAANVAADAGTLGGGNHFLEVGQSVRTDDHWLVVHSGSRRLGKAVAKYWIERADGHPRLGWLDGERAHGYFVDMVFCQTYASWNRRRMGRAAIDALGATAVDDFESVHNYVDFRDLVIRKGATRAHNDDRVVIPLNAGDGILLCEGEGNSEANRSAPHGAGRVLSRGDAKATLTTEDVDDALAGVTAAGDVPPSEAPQAYKDSDFLLDNLVGLAEPVDHFEPVLNLKHH